MENLVKGAFAPVWNLATKFARNTRGNVGMLFGLSAIPVMLAAGAAIDFSRIANAKANLIAGLDSSALYAAAITDKTEAQMKQLARTYLDKNYANTADAELSAFDLHNYADRVEATGTVKVKTWFMSIGGVTNVDVNATSQIMKAGSSVEVSLVLDNTGSMAGANITALKTAATDFVNTVVWPGQNPYYSKVAIVPYGMGVNVDTYATAARGPILPGNSTTPGYQQQTFTKALADPHTSTTATYDISTCVTERTGANAYTDAAVSGSPVGRNYPSTNNPCLSSKLLPLTNVKADLIASIAAMQASGSTAGQVGVAWGWYTLSPNFGLWTGNSIPAPYPTSAADRLHKIMILMTDAEYNSTYCSGIISQDSLPNSGSLNDKKNCNATNGDTFTQSKALCAAMKQKGVEIYTIEFLLDTNYPARVDLVSNCATDASHRYNASNTAQLNTAFQKIAQNLLELRVSK
jgi:Flp pilus assembly protein TadG